MGKIGVGIITCNRPEFFLKCIRSISDVNTLVVINDGSDFEDISKLKKQINFHYVHNETNIGVGRSKNKALRYLLEQGCDHLFLIEDDIIVKNKDVFNAYLKARNITGIQHFNFGYHGPANRGNVSKGPITPRFVVDYGDVKIAINGNSVGAFCYYTKECLDKVGLLDENFTNAFEHVDHDYRLFKAGFYTPYWNFADIANSCDYLEELECSEFSSSIRPRPDWKDNIERGANLFYNKHGYMPAWDKRVPDTSEQEVKKVLKTIYKKYSLKK